MTMVNTATEHMLLLTITPDGNGPFLIIGTDVYGVVQETIPAFTQKCIFGTVTSVTMDTSATVGGCIKHHSQSKRQIKLLKVLQVGIAMDGDKSLLK